MEFATEINNKKVILPFGKPNTIYKVEQLTYIKPKPTYDFIKRTADIIVAFVGIVLLLIPMLITYMCIAATSEGNPIYKQERLGLGGKKFYIYKFRTMRCDAEENGARWSLGDDDERLAPLGKALRKIKLDETPQLFNCLKGDLSLVGPRPEREIFYECFETYIPGFSQRLMVKPGITGLAQITGLFLKPEEKIVYDIEYIKNRSMWLDIKILVSTIGVIIWGDKQNRLRRLKQR